MQLAELIETLHRLGHRQWAKAGSQLGVSYSEYEYLKAIRDQEDKKTDKNDHGQHLQDVVSEMGVRKASASAMVVKLDERGLVKRIPCQFDARAQHILLTKAGETLLINGQGIYNDAAEMMLSKLSDRDRSDLAVLLAKLKQKT
tara:strand:+ start:110 stop:541 length:432 start_codon:yes stop_codon:yes gene_type:complete